MNEKNYNPCLSAQQTQMKIKILVSPEQKITGTNTTIHVLFTVFSHSFALLLCHYVNPLKMKRRLL